MPNVKMGQSAEDIRSSLRERQSTQRDPEQLILFDGDQAEVSFPTETDGWAEFEQVFLGQGPGGGYRIYTDALYGDLDRKPSSRYLIPVYVHSLYRAERGEYKAKTERPEQIMFMVASMDTSKALLNRFSRRNTLKDRQYVIERDGAGPQNTRYEIDRQDDKPPTSVARAWRAMGKTASDKIIEMFRKENAGSSPDKSDDEDDDYDHDNRRRKRSSSRSKRSSSSSRTKSGVSSRSSSSRPRRKRR
jgi:hypothetical protein